MLRSTLQGRFSGLRKTQTLFRRRAMRAAVGGLFAAFFFVASNLIPPIMLIPGVPITLQVLLVFIMASVLGTCGGLLTLMAVYLMTLAGLPMMSQFSQGPAAFLKPTGGYIIGWVFIVLITGLYRDVISPRLCANRHCTADRILWGMAGLLGVLLDYLCGSLWLSVYTGGGLGATMTYLSANFVSYLLFDGIKIAIGVLLSGLITKALRRAGL